MRKHLFWLFLACLLPLSITRGFAADSIAPKSLVGKWAGTATNPSGDVATTIFELKPDATFSGAAEMNHKPYMSYAGTWALNGRQLVWTYTRSSVPLPDSAKTDIDEVISVEKNRLVLLSRLSGERRVFVRTR